MRADQAGTSWLLRAAISLGLLLVCSVAHAQNGAISGSVKDTTGGALPGVTVEASSPALIEKVRAGQTDGSGQFKIVDLPIGTYTVTFTLPGFSTVAREGIQLTTGFTASVNAEMRPGSIEETITVSGASPVVDVQNVTVSSVLTRDTLDTVPTGHFYANFGQLVPGITGGATDVGGSVGNGKQTMAIHGGRSLDQQPLMNGMNIGAVHISNGGKSFLTIADGDIEEINMTIGSNPAEIEGGGVVLNLIPKTGGNVFHGSFYGTFGHHNLQSKNVDDELAAQGVATNQGIKYNTIITPSFGGPIKRDRLWFFGSYEMLHRANYINNFENLNPTAFTYTPDKSHQSLAYQGGVGTFSGRLTSQVSSKMKVTVGYMYANWCDCTTPSQTSPAQATYYAQMPEDLTQIIWTAPVTNKLLLDAGASFYRVHFDRGPQPGNDLAAAALGPSSVDENGFRIRSVAVSGKTLGQYADIHSWNYTIKGAVSYVTGSHAFKTGVFYTPQRDSIDNYFLNDALGRPAPYQMTTIAGRPNSVTYLSMPFTLKDWVHKTAFFVQDQWTTHHLTLNGGLRYDWFTGGYPGGEVLPYLFQKAGIAATSFSGAEIMNWKDLSPRLGAAYDLFGDGRTALKVGLSRYVTQWAVDFVETFNPAGTLGGNLTRTWHDDNGDFYPDGDPLNPAANGELEKSPNNRFGQFSPTLRLDPDWSTGYNTRPYQMELTAGVQHQLIPRMSVSANFFRRWYGNFSLTDNAATKPSDFDPYCITTPNDSRLPGGGNQQICGLYDLKPAAFGSLDNVQTSASKFGKQIQHWNGVDLTTNVRLPLVNLQGGVSIGKTITDSCDIETRYPGEVQVDTALNLQVSQQTIRQATDFCHLEEPLNPDYKVIGSFKLPWQDIQIGATYQNSPGNQVAGYYTARNAVIKPSLGRDLSAGSTGSVSINMIAPGTKYTDRLNQLDLLFTKNVKLGPGRNVRAGVGVYNAFNANTILSVNNSWGTTGASWLRPGNVLQGRLLKFEATLTY